MPAITAVAANEVEAMMVPLSVALPQVENKRVKILGITTEKRSLFAEQIPTLTELGVPVVMSGWQILVAPKKTPDATLHKLNQGLNDILKSEEGRASLLKIGILPNPGSTDQANQFIVSESVRWGEATMDAKIKLE
jgi:tripartite-type tricarboxylate transporter receptor subunit TctC